MNEKNFSKWYRSSRTAFTLVEIMIVVTIIALLAAIAIPNMIRARTSANQSATKATLKLISNALENYAVLNSVYPTSTTQLIGASPPYLSINYFAGNHSGYTFTSVLADYYYTITAAPVSASSGTTTYTITTGAVLSEL